MLRCRSIESTRRLVLRLVSRQDTMRGGVPIYILSLEPRYVWENRLPYGMYVRAIPRTDAAAADTVPLPPADALEKKEGLWVPSMESAPLILGGCLCVRCLCT